MNNPMLPTLRRFCYTPYASVSRATLIFAVSLVLAAVLLAAFSGARASAAVTCNKGEFLAQYRNELRTFNTRPVLRRCEPTINNDWGSGSTGSGVNADAFTARWVGTFDFEASGYEFTATSDDGVRVWVDGQLLIDQWKDQGATTYKATKAMTAGEHKVKVEYYENGGDAVAKVAIAP